MKKIFFFSIMFLLFAFLNVSYFYLRFHQNELEIDIQHILDIWNKDKDSLLNKQRIQQKTISIYDRNHQWIATTQYDVKYIVDLKDISPYFHDTLIYNEDKRFYSHPGIDIFSILRAVLSNLKNLSFVQGGSTITQQTIKILTGKRQKTISRKIYEAFLSYELEKILHKEDILFIYINHLYFGNNIYGIQKAAKSYFSKNPKDLTLKESAVLVSMIPNPSLYSLENMMNQHPRMKKKYQSVLGHYYREKGIDQQYLSGQEFEYPSLKIDTSFQNNFSVQNSKYPYLSSLVYDFIREYFPLSTIEDQTNIEIVTTFDIRLQQKHEELVKEAYENIKNKSSLSQKEKRKIELASVYSNYSTGEILTIVGGKNYSVFSQFHRAVQARRQVGSIIKPLIYLIAMDKKIIRPNMKILDEPMILTREKEVWNVHNDSSIYRGLISVEDALKYSSNTIALKIMMMTKIYELQLSLRDILNLTTAESKERFPDQYYSMALGTAEMSPLEVNQIYQIFGNKGIWKPLFFVKSIKNEWNQVLYKHNDKIQKRLFSTESVLWIQNSLKRVLEPGGSGSYISKNYEFQEPLAGKSGTTSKGKDLWFSAFQLQSKGNATVWIGHDEGYSLGPHMYGGVYSGDLLAKLIKSTESTVSSF